MAVYLVSAPMVNLIRIGFSRNPQERRTQLQLWSPIPLHLVAIDQEGDLLTEGELHWRFRTVRHHGDWFLSTPELTEIVKATSMKGRTPGAWYLPKGQYQTAPIPEFCERFGIPRDVLAKITGLRSIGVTNLQGGLALRHIPAVVDWLASRGRAVHYADLLAPARGTLQEAA